ncbi:hypothetical protein RJT34_12411 [Clitoria ternatea]|uniref:Uncharacterized protein n=1 Tax=Clitoria ternatea TaxID=43366 RepID=A0AAN9JLN5_CLITE
MIYGKHGSLKIEIQHEQGSKKAIDDLSDYESNAESGEEGSLESENEDDNKASNEEWASGTEAKLDASDNEDVVTSAEAHLKKVKAVVLQKLIP